MQYKVLTSLSFCIPGLPSFSWWCRALFWLKVNHWIPSVSDAIFMLCDTQHVAPLVDLGSNDVKHIYISESVKVDKLMQTGCYSHVINMHGSSTQRDDKAPFDAFSAIFTAGTVSGAPRIRAVELIRGLEKEKRGIYAGSVGHFDYSGDLDTCFVIRTMLFKDGVAYLQAGGGKKSILRR
ncbi:anthranilate synthase component i [Lichtheimia corymbifera JMRC:FSU:9682]|uniref:Anthranilate synthase component i n=1 Tax=Lichtheimia corymbifera JMRC:FSU:9682 TaxID=1263082 RepID=A0A068SH02_9FUNG|nr:anthranilate synthase component i [Lichtheimia corymbifera JMRC:FSU:9682]